MKANIESVSSPLAELLAIVRESDGSGKLITTLAGLGIALPVACILLLMLGLLPVQVTPRLETLVAVVG